MQVPTPHGEIEVHVAGSGPPVVMLPSLGRGAADFDRLGADVAAAGYRAVRPEPRGIGRSTAADRPESLAALAADVAAVIAALGDGPATVMGHAFGNRIARTTAADHPSLAESLILLACGGLIPPAPDVAAALRSVFDAGLTPEAHLDAVARAFFAPGNDPSIWTEGWHAEVARRQDRAGQATRREAWWPGGTAAMLVVQPACDALAVPANAHALDDAFGDRVEVVTVAGAGHALLPEQPEALSRIVIDRLRQRWGSDARAPRCVR